MLDRPKPRRRLPVLFLVVLVVITAAGAVGLAVTPRYGVMISSGGSMATTLPEGSYLFYTPALPSDLHRGDVVLMDNSSFLPPGSSDHEIVAKRIIGLPGDAVACCARNQQIEVNGKAVTEDYVTSGQIQFKGTVVPDGRFFVAGDDRARSLDSRILVGAPTGTPTIPASAIKGRVAAVRTGSHSAALPAVTAFTKAGLPGATAPDNFAPVALGVLVVAVVAVGLGVVGLLVLAIVLLVKRRRRPVPVPA